MSVINCKMCSILFERSSKGRNKKYCSDKCRYISKRTPEKIHRQRQVRLKRVYNISHEDYEETLKKQNGRCAICKTDNARQSAPNINVYWPVDHDHKTGQFRGLLCSRCNRGLGLFCEDKELLKYAIAYLSQ